MPAIPVSQRRVGIPSEAPAVRADMNIPSPAAAIGQAAEGIGQTLTLEAKRIQDAEKRIQTRRDTLETIRLTDAVDREADELWTAWKTEKDITDDNAVQEFNERIRTRRSEALTGFKGSPEGKMMLEEEFAKRDASLYKRVVKDVYDAQKAMVDQTVGFKVNELAYQAGRDPSAIGTLLQAAKGEIGRLAPALSNEDRAKYETMAQSQIVRSAVQSFIDRNDLATARTVLDETPNIGRFLTPEDQRSLTREIAAKQSALSNEPLETIMVNGVPRRVPRSQAVGGEAPNMRPVLGPEEEARAAFLKGMATKDAERVTALFDRADSAQRQQTEISRMRAAMEGGQFTTGFAADFRQNLARFADFIGVPESSSLRQAIGNAATADTLDAASKMMGVEMAKALGGRQTNMQLKFIEGAIPNLTRTPDGNKIIIDVLDRIAQRDVEIARITEDYLAATGGNTRPKGRKSLDQTIRDFNTDKPVVDDDLQKRIRETAAAAPSSFSKVLKETGEAAKGAAQGVIRKLDDVPENVRSQVPQGYTFDRFENGALFVRDKDGRVFRKAVQ